MLATVSPTSSLGALMRDSIMTEKLARRGLPVGTPTTTSIRSRHEVSPSHDVDRSTRCPPTRPSAMHATASSCPGSRWYPIVDDDGRCVGIVTRGDVLEGDEPCPTPVARTRQQRCRLRRPDDIAMPPQRHDRRTRRARPRDRRDGLVGICTRTDLLGIHAQQLKRTAPDRMAAPPAQVAVDERAGIATHAQDSVIAPSGTDWADGVSRVCDVAGGSMSIRRCAVRRLGRTGTDPIGEISDRTRVATSP